MTRNVYLDLTKGIAIFLMVLAHGFCNLTLTEFINAFHMPLFFILSGIFYNPEKYSNLFVFLKSRFKTLVVPYLSFMAVVSVVLFLIDGTFSPGMFIGGWGAMWFLPVLFAVELVFWGIAKFKNKIIRLLIVLAFLAAGYFSSLEIVDVPGKLGAVGMSLFFYYFGFRFSSFLLNIKKVRFGYVLLAVVAQFVISLYINGLRVASNNYGDFPWTLILAFTGTVITIYLAKALSTLKPTNYLYAFFHWAGKNTLAIMGFSQILNVILKHICTLVNIPVESTLYIRFIFIWIMLYFISKFLNRYARFVVGKGFSRPEEQQVQ